MLQEKQRFLTDVLHEVMLLDGLSSSHPISQEVEQATDIDRVFDWIAYKKVTSCCFSSLPVMINISIKQQWIILVNCLSKQIYSNFTIYPK